MPKSFRLPFWTVLATVSLPVFAVEPASTQMGVFSVTPTLGLDQSYDDNIFSQPDDEKASWVTVLTPSVQAVADMGNVGVELVFQNSTGVYQSSSADNYSDNLVSALAGWELNSRNQLEAGASYNHAHEDRGTGFSQGNDATSIADPDRYEEKTVDASYTFGSDSSPGRLIFELTNYDKRYTNHRDTTRGRDRNDDKADVTFLWALSGKTDLVAEARYADIDYVNDPASVVGGFDTLDSEATKYLTGLTWDATGKTSGAIKVGYATKDFDDPDRDDFSGVSWEVGMQWAPRTYSVFSLSAAREERETNGTGSFIDAKTYSVNWGHDWTSIVSTTLFYAYDDETYEDDTTGREDETATYGARIDYALRRWCDVGLSVTDINKDSTVSQFEFDRQQVTLHLLVSL